MILSLALTSACAEKVGVPAPESASPADQVTIRVVDPEGRPLADAQVGTLLEWSGAAELRVSGLGAGSISHTTDAQGLVHVRREEIAAELAERSAAVCAISARRQLMGLASLVEGTTTMEVRTSPWREVQIKVKSTELEALGLPVTVLRASIGWNDAWPFSVISMHDSMTITLPPGDYESLFYETEIWAIQRPSFSVSAGSGALRLEVDLPATRLARLYGKAAPELDSIQAWQGAGPLKLADLRGKAVILDFWGSWCGPCLAQMPELVDLYLEYHDRGLEVIAVHTARAETDADFGEQVAGLVRNSWNGRELPFPVAIDQPTAEIRPGSTRPFRGQTIAEYGITLFPTAILIDREGRVVGEFSYAGGRGRDMLAKALGLPMPPTEAPPSP